MLDIDVEVDSSTWTSSNVPTQLTSLVGTLNFDMKELMLHIADATKNPNYLGRSLNDYWAFLRYSQCFFSSGNLRLVPEYEDVDSHQKAILSDDLGMGIASLIMERAFGVKALTDTSFFLKYNMSLSSTSTGKRGPNKSPDFLVLDDNYDIHILECKGTQSGISASDKQILTGVSQKNSLRDPNGIISEKLVMGTFIAKSTGDSNSRVKIIDPEFSYDLGGLEKEQMKYLLLYSQFIKECSFILKENFNEIFPTKLLAAESLYSDEYFQKLKSEFLESYLTDRNFNIVEEYPKFSVKKELQFLDLKGKLRESDSLISFLDIYTRNKKQISEEGYEGIFGLKMDIVNS